MEMFSTEFWVLVQMAITLALVVLMIFYLKSLGPEGRQERYRDDNRSAEAADHIIAMLEPLLKEADNSARAFEEQIREKKKIIGSLNEKLDDRITSLNLLLNRAEVLLSPSPRRDTGTDAGEEVKLHEIQDAIIKLHEKGVDPESIASRLAVTRGEVELVIDLNRKFRAMEIKG